MKNKLILCVAVLLAGFSRAAPVYNGITYYNATDYTAQTALDNNVGSEFQYLYINTVGEVSASNPAGQDVWLLAFRGRDSLAGDRNIEEYVRVESSGTDGFHLNYLSAGTEVNDSLGFGGGNLLYRIDDATPGDTLATTGPGYLGFRIYAGTPDSYYYGWARVSGFIKTENAVYDRNQAQVKILELAVMDTPDRVIEVGSVVPEPASVLMLALGGGLVALKRRFFAQV